MKIAHVVSTFPPHIGGMGTVVYEEAERLQKRGHDITVFTLRYPHTLYHTIDHMFPFKVVRLNPWFRMGDGGEVPELLIQLKKFDLIHLHYPFYGGAEWVWRASRWYKKPYVVTYHMDAATTGSLKSFLQGVYDRWWAWKILRGAKTVIGVDRQHFLSTKYGKKLLEYRKCMEIKLGIDAEIFKPSVLFPSGFALPVGAQGKRIILFVGNLIPLKRLDLLLEAFKEVSFSESDTVLIVVGDGVERRHYEHVAQELAIADKVFFVGPGSDKQTLASYYASATLVVVPSDQESFSLVTAEAMASGSIVVVSDLPVLRERMHDRVDGFLFKTGDVDDLERVLVEVLHLSNEERRKIGERARESMVNNFSWEKHTDELEEVYKNSI
jgi:glycosyltransferase involved in cell wall biosynthesis